MNPEIILFTASFIYGPLKLLTDSALFKRFIPTPIQSLSPYEIEIPVIALLDNILWMAALFYQTYYWLNHFKIIPYGL